MEHYTQAEFDDLNDGVGADDWLIPNQEITRRKLIKQTPRYKIYKADWFGDVLLYEPVVHEPHTKRSQDKNHGNIVSRRLEQMNQRISQDELSSKFTELNLNLDQAAHQQPEQNLSPTVSSQLSPSFSIDSAYSSISSTPQYHTKQVRSEFEFPSPSPSSLSSDSYWPSATTPETESRQCPKMNSIESLTCCTACTTDHQQHQDEEHHLRHHDARPPKEGKLECAPLVLNRDSFRVGFGLAPGASAKHHQGLEQDENNNYFNYTNDNNYDDYVDNNNNYYYEEEELEEHNNNNNSNNCCQISWFELNELRLVAHESFMLFMGASVDLMSPTRDAADQYASLVMQMSHPKAVSLFDLLHANNINNSSNMTTTCSSPLERFLARSTISKAQQQQQPSLSLESKLNICQQVTNAMTYLHDKNIVHGRLTSVNIYIELNQRVKISLIDNDERAIATSTRASTTGQPLDSPLDESGESVSFNLPALTYLSPEIIKTIRMDTSKQSTRDSRSGDNNQVEQTPQVQVDTTKLTKSSDIYSFGTLLFELFEERYPFSGDKQKLMPPEIDRPSRLDHRGNGSASPNFTFSHSQPSSPLVSKLQKKQWNGNIEINASELIYQIGSGKIGSLNRFRGKCPNLVDNIISTCWSSQPCCRPQFKQLEFDQ